MLEQLASLKKKKRNITDIRNSGEQCFRFIFYYLNTTGLFHRIYILRCDPESLPEGGGIAPKRCLPIVATGRSSSLPI